MLKNLPWTLIWKLTRRSLRLAWKSGRILITVMLGLETVFIILPFGQYITQHDGIGPLFYTFYGFTILGISGISLVLVLYVSFLCGLLTQIFMTYLPTSKNYRSTILWGVFSGCFFASFVVTLQSHYFDYGKREPASLLVAVYGSWLAARLVDWIEEYSGLWPFVEPEKKIEVDYWLGYRFRKLQEKNLNRYQIDLELLEAGYKPEQLEALWTPSKPQRIAKPKIDYYSWGKVVLGMVVPALALTVLGAVVWWVI